eukprot:7779856-Ditylum_brightwellii.AAC.1
MEEQIATVLDNTRTEYSTVLTCEQQLKGSALLMTDLQSAMTQLYHSMYGERKGGNKDTPEVGLATVGSNI